MDHTPRSKSNALKRCVLFPDSLGWSIDAHWVRQAAHLQVLDFAAHGAVVTGGEDRERSAL
jgi:hypothetical protein